MVLGKISERKQQILKILADDASISVSEISKLLKVSEVTIRTNLNQLADSGYIVRTRGGAQPSFHPNILERQRSMVEEKTRIAKAAAGLIEDGDNIMLDAGTTPSMLVKFLLGKRDITVVTNSTLVLSYARMNPALKVILLGGEFIASSEAMVGAMALDVLKKYRVNKAFLGTDGFSEVSGFTAHSVETGEVVRQMSKQATQTYILADSAKYGEAGFAQILDLNDVYKIIIDSNISEDAKAKLEEAGADLHIV